MRALSVLVFLVLAGSAAAAMLGGGGRAGAEASAVSAGGSFSLADSSEGMPIFSATDIGPGDSASGAVTIANTGSLPALLTLAQHDLSDVPGVGGGTLSGELGLRVTDVTASTKPLPVYAGPLAAMPPQAAGRLAPGASRTYEFVAALPETGHAQNGLQGASTSVAYSWTASEGSLEETPAPIPGPTTSPGQGSSSPPPTATPAGLQPLRLEISRVRRTLRHGRLLVWASCDQACAITVRGHLRIHGPRGNRRAKLRSLHRLSFKTGTRRLAIRLPGKLRRLLQASPAPLRLKAQLALRAQSPAGAQTAARRTLTVRSGRRSTSARGSASSR